MVGAKLEVKAWPGSCSASAPEQSPVLVCLVSKKKSLSLTLGLRLALYVDLQNPGVCTPQAFSVLPLMLPFPTQNVYTAISFLLHWAELGGNLPGQQGFPFGLYLIWEIWRVREMECSFWTLSWFPLGLVVILTPVAMGLRSDQNTYSGCQEIEGRKEKKQVTMLLEKL